MKEKDTIIEEIHKTREKICQEANNNLHKINQWALEIQEEESKKGRKVEFNRMKLRVSPKEYRIMELFIKGKSIPEISRKLKIPKGTVTITINKSSSGMLTQFS